jgi:formate hydrogenlyase subunit 4
MVLDHSGPELAFITYGAALKLTLLGAILLHAAVPHPAGWSAVEPILRAAELVALAGGIGVVESISARLRLSRVPLLLAGATVLAAIAVVLVFVRRPM